MALALFIVFLVVFTELIPYIGYKAVASWAYGIYLNLFKADVIHKQRRLKREILHVKHELARTSSQDQFAKWARLRRKLDGKMSDLDKIRKALGYMKTGFELKFTTFLWLSMFIVPTLLFIYCWSIPVFYLPNGWFGPATMFFTLPFAPSGSVGVLAWYFVCRHVIRKIVTTKRNTIMLYNYYIPGKSNGG
ncbi:9577_t:CDS:2 [Paraglomus occultum]|uniref:9577_t:CDS:1 n=1 Tax=Paraglomus occultum TaxID=144539 RepID=A0A9N9BQE1_9GLOM|nr:9577_t:CDS:2 [Paraglomus occultum]